MRIGGYALIRAAALSTSTSTTTFTFIYMNKNDFLHENNILDALKITIADEHHLRENVQSRVKHFTNIISVLISLLIILIRYSQLDITEYILFIILLFFISEISKLATKSIERIYCHFIESIEIREFLEYKLGWRTLAGISQKSSLAKKYINEDNFNIYRDTWVGVRPLSLPEGGYFSRTKTFFDSIKIASYIGIFICTILIIPIVVKM